MLHKKGFTLIELLVVIAIITILAATVAPKVSNWIGRGRMARAASEIRNADLALVKMLADADRKDFGQFFARVEGSTATTPFAKYMEQLMAQKSIYEVYTGIFYELMRRGKEAVVTDLIPGYDIDKTVRVKLGTSYMDIGNDPWSKPYVFYPGPTSKYGLMGFRCYRINEDNPDDAGAYIYNDMKAKEDTKMRGNPVRDAVVFGSPILSSQYPGCPRGYPAARDLPVYIYSSGEDRTQGQYIDIIRQDVLNHILIADGTYNYNGGGDDINNWDSSSGWSNLY